jgi:hypothetical protein
MRFGRPGANYEFSINHIFTHAVDQLFGALAECGQHNMRTVTEFQTGHLKDAVNLDARRARKLKRHLGYIGRSQGT